MPEILHYGRRSVDAMDLSGIVAVLETELAAIAELSKKHGFSLVADAAHALQDLKADIIRDQLNFWSKMF